jgi:hypothetical protein
MLKTEIFVTCPQCVKKGFIVTCDASSTGIGSVSRQGPLGYDLPVAYASRVLTKAER